MLILSEAQVRQCLTIENCLTANRIALGTLLCKNIKKKGENRLGAAGITDGTALVPPRVVLPRYQHGGDTSLVQSHSDTPIDMTLFKPAAYYQSPVDPAEISKPTRDPPSIRNLMGIKIVSVRSENQSLGLPTVPATMTMINPQTGEVHALLGATYLTAARTAAGSAIATKLCLDLDDGERSMNSHLVVFGAGIQAEMHIRSIHHILPRGIQKVTIINRTRESANNLQQILSEDPEMKPKNSQSLQYNLVTLDDVCGVKFAVESADIIVTGVNCSKPLFDWQWVRPKCHINGVGSYQPTSEEVDSAFVRDRCLTIADTIEALNVGDLKHVTKDCDGFIGLLGDVLGNGFTGIDNCTVRLEDYAEKRRCEAKCTFFKSVGTAIQDIITADEVVKTATRLGVGTNIQM